MTLIPFIGIDEVQDIQAERTQHLIGLLQRKEAFALQNIMDMRLRHPGQAGEAPFGDCAAPYAFPEFTNETMLQMFEIHGKLPLRAISDRNRVLRELP